jgi:hypothetical protein
MKTNLVQKRNLLLLSKFVRNREINEDVQLWKEAKRDLQREADNAEGKSHRRPIHPQ